MVKLAMELVYLCRPGENEELRYSIRSVVANFPHSKIWVVGDKPSWYSGNFIPVKQSSSKYANARNILKEICDNNLISENFILMNDDFFITKPIKKLRVFNGGDLLSKVYQHQDLSPRSSYTKILEKTYARLIKLGIKNPLDYELHVPMEMSRTGLREALKGQTLWRSTYGNLFGIGGQKILDVKIYSNGPLKLKNSKANETDYGYLSTDDQSFETILGSKLAEMFPNPTVYEL